MRAKILSIVFLMSLSVVLFAQTNQNGPVKANRKAQGEMRMRDGQKGPGAGMNRDGQRGPGAGMNLTDAQKEIFKQSMMAMHKQLQPLRNELGEGEARQKTLVTAEKTDLSAINKNIEKIGSLRIEMAKIQAKHQLEMRAQLTDEQRLKFDLMKKDMRPDKAPQAMQHKRQMQRKHSMQ